MSKPYTEADLADQVTGDFNWRLRELSDLKAAVRAADVQSQRVLMRALVTISYAHWEGFVRYAARRFMLHVALRKHRFDQLHPQFYRNRFLPRLAALSVNRTSVSERCKLIDDLLGSAGENFARANDDLVDTRANLNYSVFRDICIICGLDVRALGADEPFLDVMLLKRRNAIAHGEDTLVGVDEIDSIVEDTTAHTRAFKDAIENVVYLKSYLAA